MSETQQEWDKYAGERGNTEKERGRTGKEGARKKAEKVERDLAMKIFPN